MLVILRGYEMNKRGNFLKKNSKSVRGIIEASK